MIGSVFLIYFFIYWGNVQINYLKIIQCDFRILVSVSHSGLAPTIKFQIPPSFLCRRGLKYLFTSLYVFLKMVQELQDVFPLQTEVGRVAKENDSIKSGVTWKLLEVQSSDSKLKVHGENAT